MIRKCRVCKNDISEFMSLGDMPIANAFVDKKNEPNQYYYALNIGFCEKCFTLQILEIPNLSKCLMKIMRIYLLLQM